MVRLIVSILVFLVLTTASVGAEPPDRPMYHVDWQRMELRVSGYGTVSAQDRGNMIEWQLEAVRHANQNLLRNLLDALNRVQVDAFQTAHDTLVEDLERNERLFRYNETVKTVSIRYGEPSGFS